MSLGAYMNSEFFRFLVCLAAEISMGLRRCSIHSGSIGN